MSDITISLTAARWLLKTAVSLVSHAFGQQYDPDSGTLIPYEGREHLLPDDGVYSRLDTNDHELMYWATTLIHFAKTVAGIVAYQIRNQDIMSMELTITENEEEI